MDRDTLTTEEIEVVAFELVESYVRTQSPIFFGQRPEKEKRCNPHRASYSVIGLSNEQRTWLTEVSHNNDV